MDELPLFIAVAEAESFTLAAQGLDMTVAAVSRRIKTLEQRLGVRLLNRTTRRVSLTEAGQIYYGQVRRLLAELKETEEQIGQLMAEPRGQLRIAAPMSFGTRILSPLVARFAQRLAGLEIQLQLDDRFVDIVQEGVDLALRIGRLADSNLIARRLAPVPRSICAAPSYLALHGVPDGPASLRSHSCLHYNNLSLREEWTLIGAAGEVSVAVQGRFCSNNGDALREAALAGLGIVLLPEFIVGEDLRTGRLERVLHEYQPLPYALFAVYPSRQFVPAKVRLFLEYMTEALRDAAWHGPDGVCPAPVDGA